MPRTTLEQALELIRQLPRPALGEEYLRLEEAADRTLSRPVRAAHDQPPFDRSPLDGFALRSADTLAAREDRPLRLPVSGGYCAGDLPAKPLAPGSAARIMTGAALPEGADCVVRQEEVEFDERAVFLRRALAPDENRVFRGEDYRAGTVLLPAGQRMDAAAVGLAASAGQSGVWCQTKLRAAVLSTGSELADPGEPLGAGEIYDGNRFFLRARLEELGASVASCAAARDDLESIAGWIGGALAGGAGLVVTSGGVSVGEKDLLPAAVERLGARVLFHGLALKPGSPVLLAACDGAALLCLSGNPFAAAATFELLGRPILARLRGEAYRFRTVPAILDTPFPKASGGRRFVRGRWEAGRVTLPEGHSSGQMRSLLDCNCLVDIPAGSGPLAAGQTVSVLPTWGRP